MFFKFVVRIRNLCRIRYARIESARKMNEYTFTTFRGEVFFYECECTNHIIDYVICGVGDWRVTATGRQKDVCLQKAKKVDNVTLQRVVELA